MHDRLKELLSASCHRQTDKMAWSGCPACWMIFAFVIAQAVNAMNISLQPLDLTLQSREQAYFNCSLQCADSGTHSLYWFVGRRGINTRRFNQVGVSIFRDNTGMDVSIDTLVECPHPENQNVKYQVQQLRLRGDIQWDGIAVQCAAIKSDPDLLDYFSHYAVLSVEAQDETTSIVPTPIAQNPVPTRMPTPSSVKCTAETQYVTRFVTETVAVTVTATVTNTVQVTATPTPPVSIEDYTSPPTSSSSWLRLKMFTIIIVTAFTTVCTVALVLT